MVEKELQRLFSKWLVIYPSIHLSIPLFIVIIIIINTPFSFIDICLILGRLFESIRYILYQSTKLLRYNQPDKGEERQEI